MHKLTIEEFNKLSPEEKREALINFTAPSVIYQPEKVTMRELKEEKI